MIVSFLLRSQLNETIALAKGNASGNTSGNDDFYLINLVLGKVVTLSNAASGEVTSIRGFAGVFGYE
jgi:ribosomal 30S subunit maturation factor RimM